MRTSETIGKIAPALAQVMKEVKDVVKNSQGFGYKYATLDEILKMARPLCAKNGITIIQSQNIDRENGFVSVETMLLHTSGEYISTSVESPYDKLKGMNEYQSIGSAITYLRRYGLSSALGISSEEDTDATAQKPQTQQTQPNNPQENPQSFKDLGIEFKKLDSGLIVAIEKQKGALYQNKALLKQKGFTWNSTEKRWEKVA